MAVCAKCKAELSDDAIFCTECGERVAQASGQEISESAEVEKLIAAANQQRVRGDFTAAVNQCTSILKQDPENPAVHCLLGDIYADQSKVEEAVRWYQMACEIDPNSRGCAERLDNLRVKLADKNAVASDGRSNWFDRFVIGESFESSIRIITFASAGFAALLIGFGLVALFSQKQPSATGTDYPPSQSAPANRRKPLVVPPTGISAVVAVQTAYEDHLLLHIASSNEVTSRGVAVSSLRFDPRSQAAIVTFTNPSNALGRRETLLNALAVAQAGFAADANVRAVTLRCLATTPQAAGSVATIIFTADIPREAAGLLTPDSTPEQISKAMQDVWWNAAAQ